MPPPAPPAPADQPPLPPAEPAAPSSPVPLSVVESDHKYIGSGKCVMCHTKAKGDQGGIWKTSKHAKAFEALAGDEAKAIAARRGIADPQKAAECLKCHTTGAGLPAERFEPSFKPEQGVQCEACHGPGSDYKSTETMKSREDSVEAGLILPDEKTCVACHNPESPSYQPFEFKTYWEKIAHPARK
ncbi:MAG: cytochrome c family protein [Planctomycetes bacterium]|nr:cytochrome c family protein [Planctomycetota bacterium]